MIAVFYDRKNLREVTSEQLMSIKLTQYQVVADSPFRQYQEFTTQEVPIGKLGYKSPDCPSYKIWDKWLMPHDLVFLRLE